LGVVIAIVVAAAVEAAPAAGTDAAQKPASPKPAAPKSTSPSTVQGVVVTAERPVAQQKIDRRIYVVGQDLQAVNGAATDVLQAVPSVEVDADGNVSLRGDSNVTILIDGKPSAAYSGSGKGLSLQQLPASEIDRIEVMTNPPAQYRAEGSGGVINIITKKARRKGLSGAVQASVGDKRRYVTAGSLSLNRGPLKLSGTVGLRQEARERKTSDARTLLDPISSTVVQSAQSIDERFRRFIPFGKAELEYAPNERQTLTASWSHRDLTGHRYFTQDDRSGPAGGPETSVSMRHSDGHEWNAVGDEGLRFEQKLARPDETLSLGFQRSFELERERYSYIDSYALPVAPQTFEDLHLSHDLVKTEWSLDYALPLGEDRDFKAGLDLEQDRNRFDNRGDSLDPITFAPTINPNQTYDYRFRQDVWAGYLSAAAAFGPWRVQSGVRYERTTTGTFEVQGAVHGGHRYEGVYPSLHLERDLSETTRLMFSASRRLNRPNPEILNPFVDYQDSHNLRAGNPNLLPEDITGVEAGWTRSADGANQGVTAYYRLYRDSVTSVVVPVGPDVVLSTVENLPKRRAEGLELTASGKLWRVLGYNLSANAFWEEIDASALGFPGLKSTNGVNGKASLDWRPTSQDQAQIAVSRSDRRLTPQGFTPPINVVNLGYRHQFSQTLAGVFTLSDAFDGQRQRRITDTPTLHDVFERHQLGQVAYLGFTWTFNAQKKAKGPGFEYEP
jgi:outer membrane receptor protein involved in Fe transport